MCIYREEIEWVCQGKSKIIIQCDFSFNFSAGFKVFEIEKRNKCKEFLKTYYYTVSM